MRTVDVGADKLPATWVSCIPYQNARFSSHLHSPFHLHKGSSSWVAAPHVGDPDGVSSYNFSLARHSGGQELGDKSTDGRSLIHSPIQQQ